MRASAPANEFHAGCDAFLEQWPTTSLVALEAMASGTPVLATRLGAVPMAMAGYIESLRFAACLTWPSAACRSTTPPSSPARRRKRSSSADVAATAAAG